MKQIMTAEVPIAILSGKLQKLQDGSFRLICLGNNVDTAVNELEKILCFLKATEPNHENTSSSPQEASLMRTLDSAEHFTECFLLTTAQRPWVFSSWKQLQFSFEMKKLVESVRAVYNEFGMPTQGPALEDKNSHYSEEQHCRRLYNLVDVAEKLVARLIKDNEVNLSVIISDEALGKKALAEIDNVYNRLDIQQHFKWRAWLHFPEDVEYKDLLRTILKQLSRCVLKEDLEVMREEELKYKLFQFLMEGRFLIVLKYDVQTVDVWLKLVGQFPDAVNGSRIIFTTRTLKVALQVSPFSYPLELRPLIEQESDVPVGRGDAVKELVARLINDDDKNLQVISVVGEEAVGKTTLARNVYNRLDIRQHFPLRAWHHVSGDLTYKDLLLIVLKQLPRCVLKNLELMSEKQLSSMLFRFLMEHRFLIVLDDVQSIDGDWLKLVCPFPDSLNGSRVILTIPNIEVPKKADLWSSPLELNPLTKEESW